MVPKETFTRADSLRGNLTPIAVPVMILTTITLDVKFDIDNRSISGNVLFKFTATTDFTKLQFDLFSNLNIEKVVYRGQELTYTREFTPFFSPSAKPLKAAAGMSYGLLFRASHHRQTRTMGMAG